MLPDVAQEIEVTPVLGPISVVHQARGIIVGRLRGIEFQQFGKLLLYLGDVVIEHLTGEQLSLDCLATGITDGTSRAAGDGDGIVASELKAP